MRQTVAVRKSRNNPLLLFQPQLPNLFHLTVQTLLTISQVGVIKSVVKADKAGGKVTKAAVKAGAKK